MWRGATRRGDHDGAMCVATPSGATVGAGAVLADLVASGDIKVVGAMYHLSSGTVELLEMD